MFLFYINDMVTYINATITLFVDDTSLYVTVDTNARLNANITLNSDLEKHITWAEQ